MGRSCRVPIMSRADVDWFWEQYLTGPDNEQHDPWISRIRAKSLAGLAPAFVATAECDPSRDDSENYAEAMKAAGVEVQCKRYAGMVHGFASWVGILPGARDALSGRSKFFEKTIRSLNRARLGEEQCLHIGLTTK